MAKSKRKDKLSEGIRKYKEDNISRNFSLNFFLLGANSLLLRRDGKSRYPFLSLLPFHNPRQYKNSDTTTIGAIFEQSQLLTNFIFS